MYTLPRDTLLLDVRFSGWGWQVNEVRVKFLKPGSTLLPQIDGKRAEAGLGKVFKANGLSRKQPSHNSVSLRNQDNNDVGSIFTLRCCSSGKTAASGNRTKADEPELNAFVA
jgi:hypothetical protein